jgi:putative membrane protein
MKMKLLAGAAIAALLVSGSAWAQDKASRSFLTEAIQGNLAEVQMGQLAQKNGSSDAVKQFGQMLVKDHSESNQEAMSVASSMGVSAPTQPNSKQKATYNRLAKLTGEQFDRAFAKDMVADHKSDIKAFEKEATKNDAAGNFAKDTLPTLRKHLQAAESLQPTTAGRHTR